MKIALSFILPTICSLNFCPKSFNTKFGYKTNISSMILYLLFVVLVIGWDSAFSEKIMKNLIRIDLKFRFN